MNKQRNYAKSVQMDLDSIMQSKTAPYNKDVESFIIKLLISHDKRAEYFLTVDKCVNGDFDFFYSSTIRSIYKAITTIYSQNRSVTVVSITTCIKSLGLSDSEKKEALKAILDKTERAVLFHDSEINPALDYDLKTMLDELSTLYILRKAVYKCYNFISDVYNGVKSDIDTLLELNSGVNELVENLPKEEYKVGDIIDNVLSDIIERKEGEPCYANLFGIEELDKKLKIKDIKNKGSEVIIVRGDRGGGKSSLYSNIMIERIRNNERFYMWSGEMSQEQTILRLLSSCAKLTQNQIINKEFEATENSPIFYDVIMKINKLNPIFDTQSMTLARLESKIRTLAKEGIRYFLLDRKELIDDIANAGMDVVKVETRITTKLRLLAIQLKVFIFLIVQSNKEGKINSALSTEQDATVIVHIKNPDVNEFSIKNRLEYWKKRIMIEKNTNGATNNEVLDEDQIFIQFCKNLTIFVDSADYHNYPLLVQKDDNHDFLSLQEKLDEVPF